MSWVAAAAAVLLAASPARAAFERLPIGPRSAALGGLLAVSSDPVFGNPAPRIGSLSIEARAWGSRPFALAELAEAQAAVAARSGSGSLGLGFRRFGSASYAEKEVRLALGWAPAPALALGAAARGLVVEGAGFAARRSLAVDGGFRFRPDPDTEVAATLEAIVGEVPGDPEGRLRRTALGASRRLGRLSLHLEVQRREHRPLAGVVGLEWAPVGPLVVRAGVRDGPPAGAWGFSVRFPGVELVASATHAALGRTVRVGLAVPPGPQG